VLDDGTHYVKNTNEETLQLLPRLYVSDGIHEVQCIVQSNSNNSANDISVLLVVMGIVQLSCSVS